MFHDPFWCSALRLDERGETNQLKLYYCAEVVKMCRETGHLKKNDYYKDTKTTLYKT